MSEVTKQCEKKSIINKLINKLKSIKNIEIILAIAAVCIVLLVYFSGNKNLNNTINSVENLQTTEYVADIENRLNNVLSNINGAGNVKVMVTIESKSQEEYATNTETKTSTSSSGTTTTTTKEEVVIIQNKPLVVNESLPKIKGVIVVAQGASNVNVKLELLKAVQTLLEIDANDIEIFIGK